MADTTYNVKVKYDLDKGKAEADANALARTFDRLAGAVVGAFAVHRILDFGSRLVGLQSEAERFTLTFATMLTGFGAPGFTKGAESFKDAMAVSAQLMMQIRLEAAKLPGTAEEMMEIMRAAMPGATQSGKSIMGADSAFEMSKRLMAAGNLLQIPGGSTTVAREFQAMMEGRAQTRNDLFARIRGLMNDGKGIGSKEFNALSESGRWEQISKALAKLVDPALPTYANTWKAISTTTLNWAQQIARVATNSPYHVLLDELKAMNSAIEINRSSIEMFASDVGDKLGGALKDSFGYLKDVFEYLVKNRENIIPVLEAAGAVLLGGKMSFGKGGLNGMIGNASMGLGINALTGGSLDLQGIMMGVAGALVSFGGALGVAAAAALAFGAAANELDRYTRDRDTRNTEGVRAINAATDAFGGKGYTTLQSIIQEQHLRGSQGSGLNEAALDAYVNKFIDSPKARMTVKDAFDAANADWMKNIQANTEFGPRMPTPDERLFQKLYDKNNAVPQKPNVNISLVIKQDISDAEDPDRILIKTKQAIEDALIRPIESGTSRFSWR